MDSRICLYLSPFSATASYVEMIDLAAAFGICRLETLNNYELATPDLEAARRLRRYADEKGVTFACTSVGVNLVGEGRRQAIETAKRYADVAAVLGAPLLHHTIAVEFEHPEIIDANRELFYEQGIAAVREVYDYAASLGLRTIYEDQGFLFNGAANYGRFLHDVERDVGTVADFGNIMFVDEVVEQFIPVAGRRVAHVHVKDYMVFPKGSSEKQEKDRASYGGHLLRACELGAGVVDFDAAFAALEAVGYRGNFSLECGPLGENEEETFRRNLAFLNRYLQKYPPCEP